MERGVGAIDPSEKHLFLSKSGAPIYKTGLFLGHKCLRDLYLINLTCDEATERHHGVNISQGGLSGIKADVTAMLAAGWRSKCTSCSCEGIRAVEKPLLMADRG